MMMKLSWLGVFVILTAIIITAGCGGDESTQQVASPGTGGVGTGQVGGLDLAIQGTLTAMPSQTAFVITREVTVEQTPGGAEPLASTATLPSPGDQLTSVAGTLTAVADSTDTNLSQTDLEATQTQNAEEGNIDTPEPAACNSLRFVEDVTVADGTEFSPGEVFLKTWLIQNVGSCPWVEGYALVFSSGYQMEGSSPILLLITIEPEGFANLSVTMRAPIEPGVYRGNWMMQNAEGEPFGWGPNLDLPFWVEIVVVGDEENLPVEATFTPTVAP
ncbi:MAG: hypothetical protein FVQ83_16370 [Chloroflexi bacterium]|nr:hypothetical protein [Chloroflexota bacterium]